MLLVAAVFVVCVLVLISEPVPLLHHGLADFEGGLLLLLCRLLLLRRLLILICLLCLLPPRPLRLKPALLRLAALPPPLLQELEAVVTSLDTKRQAVAYHTQTRCSPQRKKNFYRFHLLLLLEPLALALALALEKVAVAKVAVTQGHQEKRVAVAKVAVTQGRQEKKVAVAKVAVAPKVCFFPKYKQA